MSELLRPEEVIPHRPPSLYLSKVTGLSYDDEGQIIGAEGYWDLTGHESVWLGHFPDEPALMGALQGEAIAQLGAYAVLSRPEFNGRPIRAVEQTNKFSLEIQPPVTLKLSVRLEKLKRATGWGIGEARVGDTLACESSIRFLVKRRQKLEA